MFILPKTGAAEFSTSKYWEKFFQKQANSPFEWYGEYQELCSILHKYMKPTDSILVIGCGNSTVSANLYDVGYRKITNIDISEVIIKRMQRKYAKNRPGLIYRKMDVLQTQFADSSFSVIFDKGTLDALFSDDTTESKQRVGKMFNEIDRLLKFGGRYVCISLLQAFILNFLVDYFQQKGWLIRVCRCMDIDRSKSTEFSLPVFAVVCTKLKQLANSQAVIELSMDETNVTRTSKKELLRIITSTQEAETVCNSLSKHCLDGEKREAVIEISKAGDHAAAIRYTIILVDPQTPANIDKMSFCAFVVPLGKQNEWLFSSTEGRQVLRENCHVDRVAVVILHDGQQYEDLKAIQNELSGTVIKLAPRGIVQRGEKVTFLTMAVNTTDSRNIIVERESSFSGPFIVEDVLENNETYRRLIFLNKGNVIQSEIKLRVKSDADEEKEVDFNYVSCEYHILINVGLSVLLSKVQKQKYDVLLLGLGGGVLTTLIHKLFKKIYVAAVEIDQEVYKTAREQFYLKDDQRILVHIDDGLKYLSKTRENGTQFDAIIIDVDNKDPKVGISCPPVSFLENHVLRNVVECLCDKGLFLLNLVCRSNELKKEIFQKLDTFFCGYVSLKTKEDVNEIVVCWKQPSLINEDDLKKAAFELDTRSKEYDMKWPNSIENISDCIQKIKL